MEGEKEGGKTSRMEGEKKGGKGKGKEKRRSKK